MANILLVIDSLVGAGAQRQLTSLAVGLAGREHAVSLFFYHQKYDFLDKVNNGDIDILECRKRGRFDLRPVLRLYREIRQRKPDVVISYLRTPSIYCEAIRLIHPRFRLIVSERISVKNGSLTAGDIAAGLLHVIADRVNSNSYDYLQHLTEKLPFLSSKAGVIYNGTEPSYFSAYPPARRSGPGIGAFKFAVVAARCTEVKGAIVIAEALEKLVSQGIHSAGITWIGPVDFESAYVRRVTGYLIEHKLETYWTWQGKSDNVARSLGECDALVSASFQEGVSNVICEAMALGVPVIVSDVSDNARILDNGRSGELFEAGNSIELCQKLSLYCSLTSEELRQKSEMVHTRATELFSMSRMVSDWETLCAQVLID